MLAIPRSSGKHDDDQMKYFETLEQRILLSVTSDELNTFVTSWQGEQVTAYEDSWIVSTKVGSEAEKWFEGIESGSNLADFDHFGIKVAESLGGGVFHFLTEGDASISAMDFSFSEMSGVNYLEPNMELFSTLLPNDTGFDQLWGLHNTGQTGGTFDADIDAAEAWDIHTGDGEVIVAVIDTGVDYTHPDLANNIWVNTGEIAGDGIDNDGNGFVDDVHGYDFAYNDGDPMDVDGHGTHVAGTIGATGFNASGVIGVNPNVKIMAIKFLNDFGSGSTADAIEAVNYLTMMKRDHGVDIRLSNNSWGGGGYSQALSDAIEANGDEDILFVAAAGNDGVNNDASPHYPSNYDLDNVISVAATDHNDQLAYFSNYGDQSVDIAAPGVNIYSTTPGNAYDSYSGTSMATPHVAGALSLLMSANPALTGAEAQSLLYDAADVLPQLDGVVATGARLNVHTMLGSVTDVPGPQAPMSMSVSGRTVTENEEGAIIGSIDVLDPDAGDTHTFTVSDANFEVVGNTLKLVDGVSLDYESTPLVTVQITATDQDGLTLTQSFDISVIDVTAVASTSPAELFVSMDFGETGSAELTIENVGEGDLTYQIERGYVGVTSNDIGGPDYNWQEISSTGNSVALTDDSVSSEFNIGFNFNFYGQNFSTFRIGSNGWISLGGSADRGDYVNAPLPSSDGVNNMLALFWDDLHPGAGGQIFYQLVDSDTLVVQFEAVPYYSASGTFTGQIVLQSNGNILYQYKEVANKTTGTIGIQKNASEGMTLAYNEAYIQDEMAVLINNAAHWLTFSSESGTVGEGLSEQLTLFIDGDDFDDPGVYTSVFTLGTNDPDQPTIAVPVTVGAYAVSAYISLNEIDLLENQFGAPIGIISVEGPGAEPLYTYEVDDDRFEIDGTRLKLKDSSSLDYESEPFVAINVTATPFGGGDVLTREFVIPVTDVSPIISVDPTSLDLTVEYTGSTSADVTVNNVGDEILEYEVLESLDEYVYFEASYDWIDISSTGTSISLSDDTVSGDLSIGFDFIFYDETFDTFQIGSNGWISLGGGGGSGSFVNREIPTASGVDNMIALFWDDLHPGRGGQIFYQQINDDTLVVQYEAIPYFSASGTATMQVILRDNGSIIYQYKQVDTTNSATVGVQRDSENGLNIAYNESFVRNEMAIRLGRDTSWLTITPDQGSITYGDAGDVLTIDLNANNLAVGTYQTVILLASNDPENPVLSVPVNLTVLPSDAYIVIDSQNIDENDSGALVGRVQVLGANAADRYTYTVDDNRFEFDGNRLKLKSDQALDHEVEASVNLNVTAAPVGGGDVVVRELVIDVNDIQPTISLDREQIVLVAPAGGEDSDTLSIGNIGDGELEFEVLESLEDYVYFETTYDWIDISSTGTSVYLTDDSVSSVYDLGFDFDFYGESFDVFQIGSNGWVSLGGGSGRGSFVNQPLPSADGVDNMIALFWDDLHPGIGGQIHYEKIDNDTLVVQYTDMPYYWSAGTATIQVILNSDGSIIYQYKEVDVPNLATVGLQRDSENGLNIAFNETFVRDEMAIRLQRDISWLTVAPDQGVIEYGDPSIESLITADALGLTYGEYDSVLLISTNDSARETIVMPVSLNVLRYLSISNNVILETIADDELVGVISVMDHHAATVTSWRMTDSANGTFAFDESTGYLTVLDASLLDYESQSVYEITIETVDTFGATHNEVIPIALVEVNEAPIDLTLTNSTIPENSLDGTVVGQVNAVDNDINDTHIFRLEDSAGGIFDILTDGTLFVADGALLNYEVQTSHQVIVDVIDAAGFQFRKTFLIQVSDVIERPTDLLLDTTVVPENLPNDSLVGTVTIIDDDVPVWRYFELIDDAGGRFRINANGQILVADSSLLDYEVWPGDHSLTVKVVDSDGYAIERDFALTITDENDTPVNIAIANTRPIVSENAVFGDLVTTFAVQDQDATDTHTLTLLNDANGGFFIDSKGRLKVGDITNIKEGSVTLRVKATDAGGLSVTKNIGVNIEGGNGEILKIRLPSQTISGRTMKGSVQAELTNDTSIDFDDLRRMVLKLVARPLDGGDDVTIATRDYRGSWARGVTKKISFSVNSQLPDGDYKLFVIAQYSKFGAAHTLFASRDLNRKSVSVSAAPAFYDLTTSTELTSKIPASHARGQRLSVRLRVQVANEGNDVLQNATTNLLIFLEDDGGTRHGGPIAALNNLRISKLNPGQSKAFNVKFDLPSNAAIGEFHFAAEIDMADRINESNGDGTGETNNASRTDEKLVIDLPYVDLTSEIGDRKGVKTYSVGRTIKDARTIRIGNLGNVPTPKTALANLRIEVYNSLNQLVATQLIENAKLGNLQPGRTKNLSARMTLAPLAAGNYRTVYTVEPVNFTDTQLANNTIEQRFVVN